MADLNIPNTFVNETISDALDVNQNFDEVEGFVNSEVVHRDGSIEMVGDLVLAGPPSTALSAANRDYVDGKFDGAAGVGHSHAAGDITSGALPVVRGGTGAENVSGARTNLDVHKKSDVYTKEQVDALLAARPLMKLCNEPTRVYDNRNGHKCKTWKKVQIPSTVGGVARSGAVAAYIQIVSVKAKGPGWIAIRPDGSNWQPADDSPYSSMNITTDENNSEHMLTQIGSNGAIEFYVYIGSSDSSTVGIDGFIVDVIALVF